MTTRLDGPLKRAIAIGRTDHALTITPGGRHVICALALVALLLPMGAQADIFKCISKEGRVTFQDSPCIGATGSAITLRPAISGVVVLAPPKAPPAPADKTPAAAPVAPASATAGLTQAQRDSATLKALEADRRRRGLDEDIRDAEGNVASLKAAMDEDLAGLRARKQTLTNSVPGSILEAGATSELQMASGRYEQQIRAAEDRVSELKKTRDDVVAQSRAGNDRGNAGEGASAKP